MSASCFFASTIQTLLSIPEIVRYFRLSHFTPAIQPLSAALQDFIETYTQSNPVHPAALIDAIMSKSPGLRKMFEASTQEDAEGLLNLMSDALEREFRLSPPAECQKSNPMNLLYGQHLLKRVCGLCNKEVGERLPFFVIPLVIEQSVQATLNQIYLVEKISVGAESERRCSLCNKVGPYEETFEITSVPKYLFIRVQNNHLFKLGEGPAIEEAVEITGKRYELIGMVVRTGGTISAGHYTAYCKRDRWYVFNDTTVGADPKINSCIGKVTTLLYACTT